MASENSMPEPWRAEFDAQATPAVLDKLHRVAKARVRIYAGRTRHVTEADADDVVMGVLMDTMDGSLHWDPARKQLEQHLVDAVRFRVRDLARKRVRDLVQLNGLDEDASNVSVGEGMLAGLPPTRPDRAHQIGRLVTEVVASLQQRIGDDRDVAVLLDAMVRHRAFGRAEVLKVTRMSKAAYRNARRRLDRILLQLPGGTRDVAMGTFNQ